MHFSSHSQGVQFLTQRPWSRAYPHTHALCTHTHTYTRVPYVCIRMHAHMYACIHHRCVYTYIYIMRRTIHICMWRASPSMCAHTCTHVNMCTLANTCCIYLWTCVWAPISTHAQMWAPTQTQCTYTQTPNICTLHTHTHANTHPMWTHMNTLACAHTSPEDTLQMHEVAFHQKQLIWGKDGAQTSEAREGNQDTSPPTDPYPPRSPGELWSPRKRWC